MAYITKAEIVSENSSLKYEVQMLEEEIESLKNKHSNFLKKVDEGIKEVLDETCSDSHGHIERFCEIVGIDLPKKTVAIKIPYHEEIYTIENDNGYEIEYEVVE